MNTILSWFRKLKRYFVSKKNVRRYNWVCDKEDPRDIPFTYDATAVLPAVVDLRPQMPPVVNQGNLGSCTGNALAGALGFLELKEEASSQNGQPEEFSTAFQPFSRLFIYWNERSLEGDTSQDGGAQLRDGIKTLASVGACSENTWPYNVSFAFRKPTVQSFQEASGHKISSYQSIDGTDVNALKSCLASGYPFVFGFSVFESFECDEVANTGIVPLPSSGEQCEGGHACLCVGYDDSKQMFIVRNSWGSNWGDQGYFFLPYAYMSNPDLANDFWCIKL